jgi:dienelactone hydrolase
VAPLRESTTEAQPGPETGTEAAPLRRIVGRMSRPWFALLLLVAACGGGPSPKIEVESAGPYPVGTTRFTLEDTARGRTLPAQAWYPADEAARADAEAGFPVEDFEDEPNRATYAAMLDAAPPQCPSKRTHAAVDAAAAPGPFPLVMSSHCHDCTRFSTFTIAERLASFGFVVVAVDHTDNTLWDYLDGTDVDLNQDFLPVRAADVRFALDDALVRFDVDPEHIGVMGHSFGSVTAGEVAQDDDRIDSAFGIAAPMDNPLISGVHIAELDLPIGFLVAVEDNSITEIGNELLRGNFTDAPAAAWKIEVADAGHWTWSDLNGTSDAFPAGCGDDTRQTTGEAFTYLDPATGRNLAASYVTAFFLATLEDDAAAEAYLTSERGDGVTADAHE